MRKLIVVAMAVLFLAGVALADEAKPVRGFIDSLPDIRTGVAWDMTKENNDLLSITTVDVVKWKDRLCLGAGIITKVRDNENIDPCISLSWHIGGLEDWGFSYPLAKIVDIEVGVFAGRDLDDSQWKAGAQATILRF